MENKELNNEEVEAKLAALEQEYQQNQKKRGMSDDADSQEKTVGEKIAEKQAKNYNNYQYASSLNHIEEDEDMFARTKNGYVRTLQEINREKEIYERANAKKKSYQTVVPVSTDQITEVCKAINNNLSLKRITVDKLLSDYIFIEPIKSKGRISIENLIDIFMKQKIFRITLQYLNKYSLKIQIIKKIFNFIETFRDPFNLKEKDAENLARYLIEDNTQEIIQYRKHMDAENLLVKSRIRFVIGKVRIFTSEEESKYQEELVEKIKKYGDGLYFQLTMNGDVKKTLKVNKEQIIRAMQYIDMDLSKPLSEYYFLKLFEQTGDPNKFNLDDCTKLFSH